MGKLVHITALSLLFFALVKNVYATKLCGYLDDISPNERWILYRVPYSCKRDDINAGSLSMLDIEKDETITIAEHITLEEPTSLFLNDSIIARPTYGKIVCYDIHQKKIIGDLVTFDPELEFLEFSINQPRTHVALLLRDPIKHEAVLQIINLEEYKKYQVKHQLLSLGRCSDAISGPIYWYKDHVVYSMQNQLYDYQIGNPNSLLISFKLYDYALNEDELLFIEWDKLLTYKFKKFNFVGQKVDDFIFQEPLDFKHVKFIELNTVIINYLYQPLLNVEQQKFYIIRKDGTCKPQEKLLLYKSPHLIIRKELTTSISNYDKITRIVDKQELVIEKYID